MLQQPRSTPPWTGEMLGHGALKGQAEQRTGCLSGCLQSTLGCATTHTTKAGGRLAGAMAACPPSSNAHMCYGQQPRGHSRGARAPHADPTSRLNSDSADKVTKRTRV